MENINEKVVEIDQRSKSNMHRLDRLENLSKAIYEQNEHIVELVNELKHTNEHLQDHDARLTVIEQKAGKRFEAIITAALSALGGGVVGAFLSMVLK